RDGGRIGALIKKVAANRTVLMVEHNLGVVENLSDTITVLARGEVLAEGDYPSVSRNPQVVEAYMGSGHVGADSAAGRPRPARVVRRVARPARRELRRARRRGG